MKALSLLSFLAVAASAEATCSNATCNEIQYGYGQKMICVPGCQGYGCNAGSVDPDCAWCVYDDAMCRKTYKQTCGQIEDARAAQKAYCSAPPGLTPSSTPAPGEYDGYNLVTGMSCFGHEGRHENHFVQAAQSCNKSGANCSGVYSQFCTGEFFAPCDSAYNFTVAKAGSCVYEKVAPGPTPKPTPTPPAPAPTPAAPPTIIIIIIVLVVLACAFSIVVVGRWCCRRRDQRATSLLSLPELPVAADADARHEAEPQAEPQAEVQAEADVEADAEARSIKAFEQGYEFWFVDAEYVKRHAGPLPKHQDLRGTPRLRRSRVGLSECMEFVLHHMLTLSYIWETKAHPDPNGTMARALREWLTKNPKIKWVWIDWCCLPQKPWRGNDAREFKEGLGFVNMVYLACNVLKVVNSQYLARFWPQFEAWLSFQTLSAAGSLVPRPTRSFITFTGFAADCQEEEECMKRQIEVRWSTATLDDVKTRLGRSEVLITNLGDKEIQFHKIDQLLKVIRKVQREQTETLHRSSTI